MQDDHAVILLEDIQSKLGGLAEAMSFMQRDISEMKPQVALIPELQADIKIINVVQKQQGLDLQRHETSLAAQGMPQRA